MDTNNEVEWVDLSDDRDMNDVELNGGNCVSNEEGKEDSDVYQKITDLTDDDIRGLEFESEKKACDFYEIYAKCKGFAVRKDDVERDFNGNIVVRQLVCSREGQRNKKHLLRVDRCREPRAMTRTGCRARIRVAYNFQSGKWRVAAFDPLHNHELTPAQFVHLIPKYRRMSEGDKALVDGLHSYGIRTCHILGFMMGQKGGHRGLGFCKKDLYNYIGKQGRARIEDGDAFAALSYLQAKADNEEMFFSKFTTTDDGRLENLFWSDGVSRIDYECFGDVIAFDTTYKKNMYNKPLVIFCGYNHHGETTIFGCALVSDEKIETYKWVLNTFLEAMFGRHPTAVVTDGDAAMREAIRVVFPNSSHRLCSWHLHQNACENVKNVEFLEEFRSLIYGHYTPQKFATERQRVVDKYGLSNNTWAKKVYDMKTMWASINSFIKRYVQNKNSLVDFVHNFERAIKEYRHNELMYDFKSLYSEPVLTSALEGIEQGAAKIFTRNKFREFKNEIDGAAKLNVIERSELCNNVMLKMNRFRNPDSEFVVILDKVHSRFLCHCRLFERKGIPCSHIFAAMKHKHMDVFPNSLICKRWTKSAKVDCISSISSEDCDSEKLIMLRRGAMSAAFNRLSDISCKRGCDYKEVMEAIHNLCDKIKNCADANDKDKVSFGDDKRCGSKRKGKAVSVTPPTQVSINKKRPKPVEKVQAGGPQDNMSNIDINVANPNAFVGPNYTTEIENDFVRHGYIYRNDPVNMDGHNTQWMYGSIHEANNLPRWDQVPNHSVPMFTPFPLGGNFPSHSQTLLYHGRHSVPPNTPFMGALEEVERSAKMARNMNGNDGSSFKP